MNGPEPGRFPGPVPGPTIDLNADLGEDVTDDTALLAVVTSANVACGFHAGGPEVMRRVCELAAIRGVAIGAQVSYADREGFGRRAMDPGPAQLTGWVSEQVGLLREIAAAAGITVDYVKAHGALYNRVVDDAVQAEALLAGCDGLPVLGLPGSVLLTLARRQGSRFVAEGFPDRGYTPAGRLIPRDQPGALVGAVEAIADNAVGLARSGTVETVCVHGDSPDAVQAARAVAAALRAAGFGLATWSTQA